MSPRLFCVALHHVSAKATLGAAVKKGIERCLERGRRVLCCLTNRRGRRRCGRRYRHRDWHDTIFMSAKWSGRCNRRWDTRISQWQRVARRCGERTCAVYRHHERTHKRNADNAVTQARACGAGLRAVVDSLQRKRRDIELHSRTHVAIAITPHRRAPQRRRRCYRRAVPFPTRVLLA